MYYKKTYLNNIKKASKEKAIEMYNLEKDDIIVITGSFPKHETKHTNLMKIEQIDIFYPY